MLKTIVASIVLLFLGFSLFSQDIPDYKKGFYKDSLGRLYVQKDLPIYVWLSTSPSDSSKKYRLFSEETPKYSNPLYFDTEGYNTVRSPWAIDPVTKKYVYPKRDIVFEVYADGIAPVTKIDFGKTELYTSGGKKHLGDSAQITLSASDRYSGVDRIYYSINGEPYKPYSSPITFTEEKEYVLKYYAVDHVGNVEKLHEYTLVYDKSAPKTTLEIDGDKYQDIISGKSSIVLKTADVGSGISKIYYRIDDGSEKLYTSAIAAAYISQDEHTIHFYSVDHVGNKEAEQQYTFYVDKTAPTIIEEIMGKSFFANGKEFSSGKARLKLTSFDNKSGVKEVRYSINGGEYQVYDKPVFLTQASGNLVIKSYAVDNVNNKSTSQEAQNKVSVPYIDLTGPELSFYFTGPKFVNRDTTFINSKTKIHLKAVDDESGLNRIEYSINGSSPTTYGEAFSLDTESYVTIDMTGFDNVENTSTKSFGVKVDTTGPVISHEFGTTALGKKEGVEIYPSHTVLFLTATDKVAGFQKMTYSLNKSPVTEYKGPIRNLPKGKVTIAADAFDQLGNDSKKVIEFIIE